VAAPLFHMPVVPVEGWESAKKETAELTFS
jgi:hypothetical protein